MAEVLQVSTRSGLSEGRGVAELVLDAQESLRLLRELGPDAFLILQVVLLLAEDDPVYGWIIPNPVQAIQQQIAGMGENKINRLITTLSKHGIVMRVQPKTLDACGRSVFTRGFLQILPSPHVASGQQAEPAHQEAKPIVPRPAAPAEHRAELSAAPSPAGPAPQRAPGAPGAPADAEPAGRWGTLVPADQLRAILSLWRFDGASAVIGRNHVQVSDAVKALHWMLCTGRAINNPGAYLRSMLNKGVPLLPGEDVPQEYLRGVPTVEQVAARTRPLLSKAAQQAVAAAEARRKKIDAVMDSLPDVQRMAVETEIEEAMREFFHEPEEVQAVRWYELAEMHLTLRGLISGGADAQAVGAEPPGPDPADDRMLALSHAGPGEPLF
ncbi:hypothetical protein D5H75_37885 [Bailinhaonella thermotolerans]|uniref:Uncharacterized protein n=2 Tax=Bailinhaonella thermotolerans TaxID=1070861 RepID=A0A3A4A6B9_9ACTN|nr:hypothetical protein D5H75_37885 [Bailinhaonella thermotolerans]